MFLFLLGNVPGMQLLGCLVSIHLILQESVHCFSKWLHHFPSQATVDEDFTVELSSELRSI